MHQTPTTITLHSLLGTRIGFCRNLDGSFVSLEESEDEEEAQAAESSLDASYSEEEEEETTVVTT